MKFSLPTLILVTAPALPGAIADFWMVYARRYWETKEGGDVSFGTSFLPDVREWTCKDDALRHKFWPDGDDVSGNKHGIRMKPWNVLNGPLWHDPILTLEMNTGKTSPGHQTIYNSRGYAMVDTDDEKTGQCHVNRSFILNLDCWMDKPGSEETVHINVSGSSMFFCESQFKAPHNEDGWFGWLQNSGNAILS